MTDTGIMFLDTVHFTARRHYGVVLDSEGFILGKTPMFRTREQAWIAARDMRDAIAFHGATAREAFRVARENRKKEV